MSSLTSHIVAHFAQIVPIYRATLAALVVASIFANYWHLLLRTFLPFLVVYRLMTNCMCFGFAVQSNRHVDSRKQCFWWLPLPLIALDNSNWMLFSWWICGHVGYPLSLYVFPHLLSKWTTKADDEFMALSTVFFVFQVALNWGQLMRGG